MRRKKRIPFAFVGVFAAAVAIAAALVLFLPVPKEYSGLLFFGVVCGGSILGVLLLSLKKKNRR